MVAKQGARPVGRPPSSIIAGQRFAALTAVERVATGRHQRWRFLCDCGNEIETRVDRVKSGETSSCGCFRRMHSAEAAAKMFRTHGMFSRGRKMADSPVVLDREAIGSPPVRSPGRGLTSGTPEKPTGG
jgi:hypothetical protein